MHEDLLSLSRDTRAAAINALFTGDARVHSALARALCAADRDDVRLQLASAAVRLDDSAFVILVGTCLARGGADVVALLVRQLIERLPTLDDHTQGVLVRSLLQARVRCPTPLVAEAVDDALVVARVDDARRSLLERLPSVTPAVAAKVLTRITLAGDAELQQIGARLVDAASKSPPLFVASARLLTRLGGLPDAPRARLLDAASSVLVDPAVAPSDKLAALAVAEASFVWPAALNVECIVGLVSVVPSAQARVISVLARIGTEDAALALRDLALTADDEALRTAASDALQRWTSPLVDVTEAAAEGSDGATGPTPTWKVTPRYTDAVGTPLTVEPHRMVHPTTGGAYALDARGLPVPVRDAAQACACCERPRVLDAALRCPKSQRVWLPPVSTSRGTAGVVGDDDALDHFVDDASISGDDAGAAACSEASARHVVFVDEGHQHGVVVACSGNRVVIATTWFVFHRHHRASSTSFRVRIGGHVVTGSSREDSASSISLLVATLPVPWGNDGVVARAPPVIGGVLDVVIGGSRCERTRCERVSSWSREGSTEESFGLKFLQSRAAIGAGVYDANGRLVGIVHDDRLSSGVVITDEDLARARRLLGGWARW